MVVSSEDLIFSKLFALVLRLLELGDHIYTRFAMDKKAWSI